MPPSGPDAYAAEKKAPVPRRGVGGWQKPGPDLPMPRTRFCPYMDASPLAASGGEVDSLGDVRQKSSNPPSQFVGPRPLL